MKALITGASSGIGKDIAIDLSNLGYDLVIVARDKKGLEETRKLCKTNTVIYQTDLSVKENCIKIFNDNKDIDVLVNNAGFGLFGEFYETSLDKELSMIDLNVKAVHILTKLYLNEMVNKNHGRILNVASSAAFLPGPLMATYYATKSYVFKLTLAIYEELRKKHSNVRVSVLCPGPVDTNFNNVANVTFSIKSLSSKHVASYAIKRMFKNKLIIVPGLSVKLGTFFCRFTSFKTQLKINYKIQKEKGKNKMKSKGFTLVELLAVIVILGILFSIATVSVIKIRKDANIKAAQAIEKNLTDLGPGIYEYETTFSDSSDSSITKGKFLENYKNLSSNSSIYISIEQLYYSCYLDDVINDNGSYKLKSPESGKYCDGYLMVTKTDNGPKFQGYINCGELYSTTISSTDKYTNIQNSETLTKSNSCKRSQATK